MNLQPSSPRMACCRTSPLHIYIPFKARIGQNTHPQQPNPHNQPSAPFPNTYCVPILYPALQTCHKLLPILVFLPSNLHPHTNPTTKTYQTFFTSPYPPCSHAPRPSSRTFELFTPAQRDVALSSCHPCNLVAPSFRCIRHRGFPSACPHALRIGLVSA
jgi:hypothetical protein